MERGGSGAVGRGLARALETSRGRLAVLVAAGAGVVLVAALARLLWGAEAHGFPPGLGEPVQGDVALHDPYLVREGDTLYLFGTGAGVPVYRSTDGQKWAAAGSVFREGLPDWVGGVAPGTADAWAPTLAWFGDRWHLYYSVSTFGSWSSAIGLATTPTLDPDDPEHGWVDHGVVVRSDHEETVGRVRAGGGDAWNAIDPDVVVDGSGEPWLAWGSFAGGLYLRRLDVATGLLDEEAPVHHLAAREGPIDGIEAPNVVERDGMWYLFSSWDFCCRGPQSTYAVRVGRAEDLTGPYLDQQGRPLLEGGGSLVIGTHGDVIGPGHSAVVRDGDDWVLVHHYYDGAADGRATLSIRPLLWTGDGWPVAAPPGFVPGGGELSPDVLAGSWELSGYEPEGTGGGGGPIRFDLTEDGDVGQGAGTWGYEDGVVTVTVAAGCGDLGGDGEDGRTYELFVDAAAEEMHGRAGDGVPVRARRAAPGGAAAPAC